MFRSRTCLATALAVAYVTCPLVEPIPDGPAPAEPWWLVTLNLASVASIVVAVVAVARAARSAGRLTVLAGVGMVGMTVSCPVSGHHVTGWWTWWQAGMSASVILAGLALAVRPLRRDEWAVLPSMAGGLAEERLSVVVLPPAPPVPAAPAVPDVVRARRHPERPQPVRPAAARPATGPAKTAERAPGRRVAR